MNKNLYVLGVLLLAGVWMIGTGFFLRENGISLNLNFSPNYVQRSLPVPAPIASAENFLSDNLFAADPVTAPLFKRILHIY